jgi:hypothetical protein
MTKRWMPSWSTPVGWLLAATTAAAATIAGLGMAQADAAPVVVLALLATELGSADILLGLLHLDCALACLRFLGRSKA